MGDVNKKKVIMACTHPYWSALQVGSQHLARQFARHGWQVAYFSASVTPLHLLKAAEPEIRARFRRALGGPVFHENSMICSHVPFSLIAPDGRPLLRGGLVSQKWHYSLWPSAKNWSAVGTPELIYIDNLSYHFLPDLFEGSKVVFRVMDMHERFFGWNGRARMLAEKIAARADLTIYSAQNLESYVKSLGAKNCLFVPNGVDFKAFSTPKKLSRPDCIRNISDPILLYTGMIDSRLDWHLLIRAARRLPGFSFVFTGPVSRHITHANMPANLYFTGPVAHKELPALMQAAAAGLIPFDVDRSLENIQGIRPLKLMEYLAAGLPVISARWPEIEALDSPAWFYENVDGFVALAEKALGPEMFDCGVARGFACQYDWKYSFKKLLAALGYA